MGRRWLGGLLLALGAVLMGLGYVDLRTLLAAPLEAEHTYLPGTLFPAVGGLWSLVLGVYALTR